MEERGESGSSTPQEWHARDQVPPFLHFWTARPGSANFKSNVTLGPEKTPHSGLSPPSTLLEWDGGPVSASPSRHALSRFRDLNSAAVTVTVKSRLNRRATQVTVIMIQV